MNIQSLGSAESNESKRKNYIRYQRIGNLSVVDVLIIYFVLLRHTATKKFNE